MRVEQVKLADLLSKAGPRVRPLAPGKYPYAPDSFRTSACCLVSRHGCLLVLVLFNPLLASHLGGNSVRQRLVQGD